MTNHLDPVRFQFAAAYVEAMHARDQEAIAALNAETDLATWQGAAAVLTGLLLGVVDRTAGPDAVDDYVTSLRHNVMTLTTNNPQEDQ